MSTTPLLAAVNDDDATTLQRCALGDGDSLQVLYERYGASCLLHARSVLRDRQHAEDAVQEAFLDLWRGAAGFDASRCSVRGWVHVLTHRRAIDRARSEQRRRTAGFEHLAELATDDDPAGEALGRIVSRQAVDALNFLPETQRRCLVLAYWGGYTMAEIAVLEGIPIGTVKSRSHAAMASLRLRMKPKTENP